jgi:hypothetical protein
MYGATAKAKACIEATSCELTVQFKVIHRARYYEIQDGKGNVRLYDRKLQ